MRLLLTHHTVRTKECVACIKKPQPNGSVKRSNQATPQSSLSQMKTFIYYVMPFSAAIVLAGLIYKDGASESVYEKEFAPRMFY